jgi:hypothetical protein
MSKQYTYRDYYDALVRNGGSRTKTAADLGVDIRNVYRGLKKAKKYGLELPQSPHVAGREVHAIEQVEPSHNDAAPDGFSVRGVSTLRDGEGNVVAEWTKTQAEPGDAKRLEMLRAAVEELKSEIPPQMPIPAPMEVQDEKLLNCFTITDYHMGMLAWRHEGGADWDLDIAERMLLASFSNLVFRAPAAKYAIVNQLGDFMHTDGFLPVTPASKHVLDADSRYPKIVKVAIRALRAVVNMALMKHEIVYLLNAEGNHSPAGDVWLRELFQALYENEPRVIVETSPLPYYARKHGKTMLGFHHGHLRKPPEMPGTMAAQFPAIWGTTEFRYCHMGHMHHKWLLQEKEDKGMTVKQHRTLASRDAYAARGAWFAERAMECNTYHAEHGEVGSVIVKPSMVA